MLFAVWFCAYLSALTEMHPISCPHLCAGYQKCHGKKGRWVSSVLLAVNDEHIQFFAAFLGTMLVQSEWMHRWRLWTEKRLAWGRHKYCWPKLVPFSFFSVHDYSVLTHAALVSFFPSFSLKFHHVRCRYSRQSGPCERPKNDKHSTIHIP